MSISYSLFLDTERTDAELLDQLDFLSDDGEGARKGGWITAIVLREELDRYAGVDPKAWVEFYVDKNNADAGTRTAFKAVWRMLTANGGDAYLASDFGLLLVRRQGELLLNKHSEAVRENLPDAAVLPYRLTSIDEPE